MKIRPYMASDLDAAVHLFTASVHGLAHSTYDAEQLQAWAPQQPDWITWQQLLRTLHTWLVVQDHSLGGLIAWDQDGHIALLYTAPGAARRGVASALYRHAETTLLQQGVRQFSTAASLVARPFFEHHGFTMLTEESVERHGVLLRRFVMAKNVPVPGAHTASTPAAI